MPPMRHNPFGVPWQEDVDDSDDDFEYTEWDSDELFDEPETWDDYPDTWDVWDIDVGVDYGEDA